MSKVFGFVQLDFAGTLPLADGRYLARDAEGAESVLVVRAEGASGPPPRRRRRPRQAEPGQGPPTLALTRVTAIQAFAPFESEREASGWLGETVEVEESADAVVEAGVGLLNRALHAQAVAGADPLPQELPARRAVGVRIGYGSGEELADGRFAAAREIDVWAGGSPRRRKQEALQPQQRVAAVLGGRERLDACETLLLRARADLDAGRDREATLQLRVGLEALLAELKGALADPEHERDFATLHERRHEAGTAANRALQGELDPESLANVTELLQLCERVIRRRRVLRG